MQIKYMGTVDVRDFLESDTLGGLLGEPIGAYVAFNRENNWVIDTDDEAYADVDPEVWVTLTETWPTEFKNVSDFKRVPLNLHQKMFLGMVEGQQMTVEEEDAAAEERRKALASDLEAEVALSNAQADQKALEAMGRDALNELADKVGVADPEKLKNKGEVIDAIKQAQTELTGAGATPTSPGAAGTPTSPGGSTGGVGGAGRGGGGTVGGSTSGTGGS